MSPKLYRNMNVLINDLNIKDMIIDAIDYYGAIWILSKNNGWINKDQCKIIQKARIETLLE